MRYGEAVAVLGRALRHHSGAYILRRVGAKIIIEQQTANDVERVLEKHFLRGHDDRYVEVDERFDVCLRFFAVQPKGILFGHKVHLFFGHVEVWVIGLLCL